METPKSQKCFSCYIPQIGLYLIAGLGWNDSVVINNMNFFMRALPHYSYITMHSRGKQTLQGLGSVPARAEICLESLARLVISTLTLPMYQSIVYCYCNIHTVFKHLLYNTDIQ